MDKDGSKEISKSEMTTAMSQIGITTTSETINYLFKLCDSDGDDRITCPEL